MWKMQWRKALKYFTKLKKFYKQKICICYPKFLTKQNRMVWNERKSNINYRLKNH
jgi:hypothetical protein